MHLVIQQKLTHHCKAIILQQRCKKKKKLCDELCASTKNGSSKVPWSPDTARGGNGWTVAQDKAEESLCLWALMPPLILSAPHAQALLPMIPQGPKWPLSSYFQNPSTWFTLWRWLPPSLSQPFAFDRRILVVQDWAMKWSRCFMWLQSDFSWGCSRLKAWLGWTTKMAPSHGWLLRLAVIWELIWGCQPTCGLSMRLELFTAWWLISEGERVFQGQAFQAEATRLVMTTFGSSRMSLLLYSIDQVTIVSLLQGEGN